MGSRLIAALAVLVGLVVLLAGCGGGGGGRMSKTQYEQKINADVKELTPVVQELTSSTPTSLNALAAQVKKTEDAVNKVADDLDSIKPPQDAEADNGKIVVALRSLADSLGRLRKAAAAGDVAQVTQLSQELLASSALKDGQAALNDLKSKGYDVTTLGG